MTRKRLPTSRDVAEVLGVSQAMVSRAFSSGSVAPALRERILATAATMGYRPNAIARSLTQGRSHLVAVLISDQTSLIYPELVYGLTEGLGELGYRVILFTSPAGRELSPVVAEMMSHHVDGVITTLNLGGGARALLARSHVPLICFNQEGGDSNLSVYCDHFEGGRLLAQRLLKARHATFGLLGGKAGSFVSQELVRGVRSVLDPVDAPLAVVACAYQYEAGPPGLREIENILERLPDVLICLNDTVAAGCIDYARFERHLTLPDDLSVVGFNGRGPLMWTAYRLTTMSQPIEQMTRAAVRMLHADIIAPSATAERRVYLPALVTGATARLD